ncbi:hypothetical protein M7I_7858 [Glarea lozoyensis 74030]|uniref:LysM domain-containing protein n=1 Tax=Glarea lozoyensis (strain ATCC 74030 / MF5533) TaxID=1104152 RepID=H0EYF6_GLAL7|nr:hypothetical protein M7I_7858 [Glarea lozoyensis 74030]
MLANINMKILVSIASVMISTKVAAVVIHPRDCSFTWAAEIEDTCQSMASSWEITEAQFISYNPGVVCSALVAGKEYCVEPSHFHSKTNFIHDKVHNGYNYHFDSAYWTGSNSDWHY